MRRTRRWENMMRNVIFGLLILIYALFLCALAIPTSELRMWIFAVLVGVSINEFMLMYVYLMHRRVS